LARKIALNLLEPYAVTLAVYKKDGITLVEDIANVLLIEKDRVEQYKKAEKKTSDAYLRIRTMLGAFDTNYGGENRFEVTEKAVATLQTELADLRQVARELKYDYDDARSYYSRIINDLQAKLSVARECLTLISTTYAGTKEIKLIADEGLAQIEGTK
jgi:hypothetical protein